MINSGIEIETGSILKSKDIKLDQIKNILVQMDSTNCYLHDANIYISISRYF